MTINENHSKLRNLQTGADHGNKRAPKPPVPPGISPLARLRLMVVLDTILATQSVSDAARELDLSTPAVSRLLSQARQLFGDRLMIRSGRGLVPTVRAEQLRERLRALRMDTDALLQDPSAPGEPQPPPLEGAPSDQVIRKRRRPIGQIDDRQARLARYIATVGAGKSRTRPLDMAEACDAYGIILDEAAREVQIGALLVGQQLRGIAPQELAGMVAAARRGMPAPGQGAAEVDLDWPAYLSPRNQNPPWFLLAARLLAGAGHRIVLHGQAPARLPFTPVLEAFGIPLAASPREARQILGQGGCAFLPLSAIHPHYDRLMDLYRLFEMRSPLNLGLLLLNPLGARTTLMGIPSTTQKTLHREAAELLGWPRLLCIDSHRDVAQATPHRLMRIALTEAGQTRTIPVRPAKALRPERLPPGITGPDYCVALWNGSIRDTGAMATVLDTVALALIALDQADLSMKAARANARALWQDRRAL